MHKKNLLILIALIIFGVAVFLFFSQKSSDQQNLQEQEIVEAVSEVSESGETILEEQVNESTSIEEAASQVADHTDLSASGKLSTGEDVSSEVDNSPQAIRSTVTFKQFESMTDALDTQFEYDADTDEYRSKKNKNGIIGLFGSPDLQTQIKGMDVWVYYDLIDNEKDYLLCVVFTFYEDGALAVTQWPTRERLPAVLGN